MRNFGTLILWALAACTFWHGSLAEEVHGVETSSLEAKLVGQLQAIQTKVEESQAKLEGSLLAVQNQLQQLLNKMENQLQALSNKTNTNTNIIPPGFERIGTRYFHKGNERVDWSTAKIRCNKMGGYLASFRNEEEFTNVTEKLESWQGYWLGINRDTDGHFVSLASHKPTIFLKWHDEGANGDSHRINCVLLHQRKMWDHNCDARWNFVCQADSET